MKTISLDGVWHLCGRNEETGEGALSLTARVPDCVAEYFLNGVRIGESRNMLISHEFAVGDYAKDGTNTLTVNSACGTWKRRYALLHVVQKRRRAGPPRLSFFVKSQYSYNFSQNCAKKCNTRWLIFTKKYDTIE